MLIGFCFAGLKAIDAYLKIWYNENRRKTRR